MVFDKLKELISEQMDINLSEITLETNFTEDLDADSFDILQMITDLEEIYDVEFSNEDAENIKTINDVVIFIEEAIN